jgi:predicted ATP-grasp superfamily ATP-dependent carboligase
VIRVLLYEWCCSGGLAGQPAGSELEALLAEGRLMLEALAADAARDPGLDVTVLIDAEQRVTLPSAVRGVGVRPGEELDALMAAAAQADWSLVVAPETDGILADRGNRVREAGGRCVAPEALFLALAADKQATIDALAAAGVPVPAGRSLAAGEPLPAGFHLPAVRKPRASAGGDGLQIIRVEPAAAGALPVAARLEAFVPGTPVGVSCLCGGGDLEILPPLRQRFTGGDRPHALGHEALPDGALAARAARLARRAVAALERAAAGEGARGWVGIDMILGRRDDGRGDRVLEVNPRVTTSFAVHSRGASRSLVRSLIDRASLSQHHASLSVR